MRATSAILYLLSILLLRTGSEASYLRHGVLDIIKYYYSDLRQGGKLADCRLPRRRRGGESRSKLQNATSRHHEISTRRHWPLLEQLSKSFLLVMSIPHHDSLLF